MIIDIKGFRQEENNCQPSKAKAKLEIEQFPGERGKGLKVGDKVLLAPIYANISDPIEYDNGHAFIVKNIDWKYGIVFISQDLKVKIFQSNFSSQIMFVNEEGCFFCQDGGYFDHLGKKVER